VLLQNFYACSLAYVFAPLLLAVQHGELAGAVEGVEVLDHGPLEVFVALGMGCMVCRFGQVDLLRLPE
jgi:hypothetical protein